MGRLRTFAGMAAAGALALPAAASGEYVSGPSVAVNDDGVAALAWTFGDPNTPPNAARGLRIDRTGELGTVTKPSSAALPNSDAVAIDGAGRTLQAWLERDTTTSRYRVLARVATGAGAASVRTLSSSGIDAVGAPRVALDADGDAVVVWLLSDGRVQLRRIAADLTVGRVVDVAAGAANPGLAVVPSSGLAHVTWEQEPTVTTRTVRHRTVDTAGSRSAARTLSPAADVATLSRPAVDDSGTLLVAWLLDPSSAAGTNRVVQLRRMDAGGSVGGIRTLSSTSEDASRLALDTAGNGRGAVAWSGAVTEAASRAQVRAVKPSGSLGAVNVLGTVPQEVSDVAVGRDGRIVVGFLEDPLRLVVRSVSADGVVSSPCLLENRWYSSDLALDVDGDGEITYAWQGYAGEFASVLFVMRNRYPTSACNGAATPTGQTPLPGEVVVDSAGTATATYTTQFAVAGTTMGHDGEQGNTFTLLNDPSQVVYNSAEAAVGPDRSTVHAWRTFDPADPQDVVAFGRKRNLAGFLSPVMRFTEANHRSPAGSLSVAAGGNGRAAFGWLSLDRFAPIYRFQGQRMEPDGTFRPPVDFIPPGTPVGEGLMDMAPDGRAAAAWRVNLGGNNALIQVRRWESSDAVSPIQDASPAMNVSQLRLGVDAGGTAHVVWREVAADGSVRVILRRFGPDGSLGSRRILIDEDISSYHLDVAPDGTVLVAWRTATGEIWARQMTAAGTKGRARRLAGGAPDAEIHAHGVAAAPGGGGLVAFRQGAMLSLFRLSPDGLPGGRCAVTTQASQTIAPVVDLAPDGDAVVAWASVPPSGQQPPLRLSRFSAVGPVCAPTAVPSA